MSIVHISRKVLKWPKSDAVTYFKTVIQRVAEFSPQILQHPRPNSQRPVGTGGGWEIIDPSLRLAGSQEMNFKCVIVPAGEGLLQGRIQHRPSTTLAEPFPRP